MELLSIPNLNEDTPNELKYWLSNHFVTYATHIEVA